MADEKWSGRTRGGRWGNLFFVLLIRGRLLWLTPFFLFWVSLYFVFASPAGRRASYELATRLGRKGRLRRFLFAWRHNFTFGTLLIERLAILSGHTKPFCFDKPKLHKQENVVLVTAHIGSWEIMGQLLADPGLAVTLVMHEGIEPRLRELLNRGRSFEVLQTDGSPSSAAAILQALQAGGIVGMMGDRLLADEGVSVDFLKAKARFPVGPYAIAAAARATVLHVFAVRTGRRRYEIRVFDQGVPRYADRKDKRKDHARWAAEFAARLEELVRVYPTQWGNFFSIWETD